MTENKVAVVVYDVEGRQASGARREKKEVLTKISDSFIDEREQNYKTREIGLSPRCDRE